MSHGDDRITHAMRRLGRFLTSQREKSGLTRSAAEKKLRRTRGWLEPVERGERLLSIGDVRQMATLYGFDEGRVHRIQSDACPKLEELYAGGTTISVFIEPFGKIDVVPDSIPMMGRQLLLVLEKLEVIHCTTASHRIPSDAVDLDIIAKALGLASEHSPKGQDVRRLIAIMYPAFAPMLYFLRGNRTTLSDVRLHTTALLVAVRRALQEAKAVFAFALFCELLRRFADEEITEDDFRAMHMRMGLPPKPLRKAA